MTRSAIQRLKTIGVRPYGDASVTNMYTINKHLSRGVEYTDVLANAVEQGRSLSGPFLTQPQIMFQPKEIWEKVIYPNRQELPIIKYIPL